MSYVSSMTGFATAQGSCPLGHLTVEVRCVNSRFLDLTIRPAEELRPAEGAIREIVTKRVGRGKLEMRLSIKKEGVSADCGIDTKVLEAVRGLEAGIIAAMPSAKPLTVAELLAYPGIITSPAIDENELIESVCTTVNTALDRFIASRRREGEALKNVLTGYCDKIDAIVAQVAARTPQIIANMQGKLNERLQDALGKTLGENSVLSKEEVTERIRQEVLLYALRIDVDEEMNRLLTHVKEVRRVLGAGGATGRRLDFIMQEMNREANTLGSKAAAIEMTNASIDLKIVIEQMREQIQNLE